MPISKQHLTDQMNNKYRELAGWLITYWENLPRSPKKDSLTDLYLDAKRINSISLNEKDSISLSEVEFHPLFLKKLKASYEQIEAHRTSRFWTNAYFLLTILPPFALFVIPFNLLVFKSWTWRSQGSFLVEKVNAQLTEDFVASEELFNTANTVSNEANNAKKSLLDSLAEYKDTLKNISIQYVNQADSLLKTLDEQFFVLNNDVSLVTCNEVKQTSDKINVLAKFLSNQYKEALLIVTSADEVLVSLKEQIKVCEQFLADSSTQCIKASEAMSSLERLKSQLIEEITEQKIKTIRPILTEVQQYSHSLNLRVNSYIDTLKEECRKVQSKAQFMSIRFWRPDFDLTEDVNKKIDLFEEGAKSIHNIKCTISTDELPEKQIIFFKEKLVILSEMMKNLRDLEDKMYEGINQLEPIKPPAAEQTFFQPVYPTGKKVLMLRETHGGETEAVCVFLGAVL